MTTPPLPKEDRAHHTPGPWFIPLMNATQGGSSGTSVWALGGDARIADCNSGGLTLEGRRADARLIAAAPELLATLEAILALDDGDSPDLWHFEDEFAAGRAAIAKATGAGS